MWLLLVLVPALAILALRPGASGGRRVLAASLVLTIPIVGPLLAVVARNVRGKGTGAEPEPSDEEPAIRWSPEEVRRMGELPPMLERLMSPDYSERLAALVMLSSVPDMAARSLLRWAIEHGPPEVVLDAALTLDELDMHREKERAG
jgi:hypothetical protein